MARKSYKRGRSRKFRGRRGGGISQLFGAPYPSCVSDKQRYDNCQKVARQSESAGSSTTSSSLVPSVSSGFGLGSLMTPAASVPAQNNYASQNYAVQNYAAQNDIETGLGSSSGYGAGEQPNYGAQRYQAYGGGSMKRKYRNRKHRRTNKKRHSRRRR
jgi:hypothetical protein